MVVEYKKVYLTIEDYLIFLLKLYYFKEKELLKETIFLNKHRYMIEGHFEDFIKNIYIKQKSIEKEMKNEEKKEEKENKKENNNIKKEKIYLFTENLIKMIEKIFPELLSSSDNKNKNDKGNIYLDYIFNNNFKYNEVTPDKIISLVNIDHYSPFEKYLHKPFSIPFYFQINALERGKYFGHTALETNSKGALTIITIQDSSFGIIEKNDYFRLLSKINKELDMNFYSTLYNLPFFKNISKSVFQRFYSSFFEYHLYKRNAILYKMKQKTNILYLIKNGRFSIYIKGNMIDVYDILIYLQSEKNKKLNNNNLDEETYNNKNKIIEIDEKNDIIYNKKFKSKEFNDAVYAQNEIYLGSFEGNNLIGLGDFIDKKNKMSLFTIKIESNYCELYEITNKNFNIIISDYSSANDLIEEYELKKINLIINKIISYKKIFFSSIEKKENEDISQRLNIQKKEKKTAILNKTQKTLKVEKLKKNIYLSLLDNKNGETNKYKFNRKLLDTNVWSISFRTLKNSPIKKNFSEKKRRMMIKEKILENQNKDLFLLENGDVKYKNKILEMKKNFISKQNMNKRLSMNKDTLTKNESNKFDTIPIYNNNNNNLNYILSDNFFVDKIKQALSNNNSNNNINHPLIERLKNEKKLYYINILANGNNNMSSKKVLLLPSKNKNNIKRKVNKSVGTSKNKMSYLNIYNYNYNKNIDNKEIKKENNFIDNNRNKETMNKVKLKIEEYQKRERAIYNKLKIDINKLQDDIKSSSLYSINMKKSLETKKQVNLNKIFDEFFYWNIYIFKKEMKIFYKLIDYIIFIKLTNKY